jgi:hypothetical protein
VLHNAQRLTGEQRLPGFIGGFHLTGGIFEPIIKPTVDAFVAADVAESCRRTAPAGQPSTSSRAHSRTRPCSRRSKLSQPSEPTRLGGAPCKPVSVQSWNARLATGEATAWRAIC